MLFDWDCYLRPPQQRGHAYKNKKDIREKSLLETHAMEGNWNRKKVRMHCLVCQKQSACANPFALSAMSHAEREWYDEDSHRVAKCSHCHGIDRQSDSKQKFNETSHMSFAVSGNLKISEARSKTLKRLKCLKRLKRAKILKPLKNY